MKNNYKNYTVTYWDLLSRNQGGTVNFCFGNSLSWVGRARTREEAIRKASKGIKNFTLRNAFEID